jgi:magnesium chelatase family protein
MSKCRWWITKHWLQAWGEKPLNPICKGVEAARKMRQERFAKHAGVHTNSSMTPCLIKKHYALEAEASGCLEHAMSEMNFSARDRILKVARTLAELGGHDPKHR